MHVLVTGGAGYLGSVLVPQLRSEGHEVTVLDRFFFGSDTVPISGDGQPKLVRQDIRWVDGNLFQGVDAVVDLAALSNDPAGELDPWKTLEINYLGRSRVARLAREAGVSRYVVSSSCSIYGFQTETLTEDSRPNPLTVYARANELIEQDNLPLASPTFTTTALRFATLYGLSPRMRFDLAINGMVRGLFKDRRIPILRDGTQWRPFVHIKDTARAMMMLLDAPRDAVGGEVFNIGADEQNYQIMPLARLVTEAVGMQWAYEWYGVPDHRSYRVTFRKVGEVLGFKPQFTPREGARETFDALRRKTVDPDDPRTITVTWYKQLFEAKSPA